MLLKILITFILVFLNGFFVAAEFAIVKIRASQLEPKVQEGNRFAILSKKIVSHLDGYLAATQFGITLASLGLGWIGEPVVSQALIGLTEMMGISVDPALIHKIALPVAFTIITVLHIVFGELAPKSIAIQRPEATTLFVSYPLHGFYLLFRPIVWLLNGVANVILKSIGITPVHGSEVHTSDELRYLVHQQKESGVIEAADYDLIKNAFDFSERTVRQIMVPRNQILAIDINEFSEERLEFIIQEGYSRVPVYQDSIDDIIGVIHLKDILLKLRKNEAIIISEVIRPVTSVPESKLIGSLLREFQRSRQQIAVIFNEYGGVEGIVTMEDILEELVGEIQDEYDNESGALRKQSDGTFLVKASIPIEDLNELLPLDIEKDSSYETLAGFLISKLGKIPVKGDRYETDDYTLSIEKVNRHTLSVIRIELKEES